MSDNHNQHYSFAQELSSASGSKKRRRKSFVGITTSGPQLPVLESHFTPGQLAAKWGVSANLVRRLCQAEGGIFVIDRPEEMHKRRYKTVRIPQSTPIRIYERYFLRRAA